MSTDTALALGMLALTGPRFPDRVRAFLLSVAVVDDLVSLVVIGAAYSRAVTAVPLGVAAGIFAVILALSRAGIRYGALYALLGTAAWVAVFRSGIDPVVVGLAMGLATYAHPAARTDLERASDLFRRFREQPTSELARSASAGLASALSPNERLQQLYHPWTSYVIVPPAALRCLRHRRAHLGRAGRQGPRDRQETASARYRGRVLTLARAGAAPAGDRNRALS